MISRRILPARWWLLTVCLWGACCCQAEPPPGEALPPAPVTILQLPMSNNTLSFDVLIDELAPHLGSQTRYYLLGVRQLLPKGALVTDGMAARLATLSQGAVTMEQAEGVMTIRLDRRRLQQQEKDLRHGLGQAVAGWFPEAAAANDDRYGLMLYEPGRLDVRALAHAHETPTELVVLVHGLDDPGGLWNNLIPLLLEADCAVAELTYPNDQAIVDSAAFMAAQLGVLRSRGTRQVSLVAHSMGGLVSRELLTSADHYAGSGRGQETWPDVDRLIMVGTPNHGSEMARLRIFSEARDHLGRILQGDGVWFSAFMDGTGEAQVDLLPGSSFLTELNARSLPADVELTIIAGRASPVKAGMVDQLGALLPKQGQAQLAAFQQTMQGLVDGMGDGCVSLQSARLAGVDDWVVVDGNHLSMLVRLFPGSGAPPAIPVILKRLEKPLQDDE